MVLNVVFFPPGVLLKKLFPQKYFKFNLNFGSFIDIFLFTLNQFPRQKPVLKRNRFQKKTGQPAQVLFKNIFKIIHQIISYIIYGIAKLNLPECSSFITAKPGGLACIDEQQNATNVSRIIATFCNFLSYVYKMLKAITYRMSRCIGVAMYR